MSVPRIVSLWEYQRLSAKKTFSVPSVTMNGGSRSRVTSSAVDAAAGRADGEAEQQGEQARAGPGRPPSLAITIEDRTMIAPTERSMPAVRMISVWAMPSVPTTITCWTISDRLRRRQEAVRR